MLAVNQQLAQPIDELLIGDTLRVICEFGLSKENFFEIFACVNTVVDDFPQLTGQARKFAFLALPLATWLDLTELLGQPLLNRLLMNDPTLTLLDVSEDHQGDLGLVAGRALAVILKNSPHVNDLRFLYYTGINDIQIFTDLGSNPHLRVVTLSRELFNVGAEILGQMTHLRSIDVSSTQIGADGARALASLPNLKYLNLDDNILEMKWQSHLVVILHSKR